MSITGIKIVVLDVQDADAIIVNLYKETDQFIMLLDGGRIGDSKIVIRELDQILKVSGKKGPNLVVCTHYDSDHIGGLKAVVNHYKTNIGTVFIHRTSQILDIVNLKTGKSEGIFPSENDAVLNGGYSYMDVRRDENIDKVLETVLQEKELIELVDSLGIPSCEPVAGGCQVPGWEEIRIIGPTLEYYQKLFPANLDKLSFLKEEAEILAAGFDVTATTTDPCEALDTLARSRVTPTNLNSAIIKIEMQGKSFLFTGDAGISSLYNISNYETDLKDIYWLKVPHHGSRNNINRDLIELMSPRIAVVSGNRHVDGNVINCLRSKGTRVDITRDAKVHLHYEFSIQKPVKQS
jgi:beta-lactamase superfamily II metal-dependent hydrolase